MVFDVNVYLDVASLLGPPFDWDRFAVMAHATRAEPLPHLSDGRKDSLRAIAVSMSGSVCKHQRLQVWTSHHIDGLVVHKASSPADVALPAERRGLGWSDGQARLLLQGFVHTLAFDMTSGGTLGKVASPWGSPPLDHEDGCVYATARDAGPDEEEPVARYCVTRDVDFLRSAQFSNVTTLDPAAWVEYVRLSRRRDSALFPR